MQETEERRFQFFEANGYIWTDLIVRGFEKSQKPGGAVWRRKSSD